MAEATDHRKGPLNGDAFRLCEAEVLVAHGPQAFVLAQHVYSDSSVVSWSGGELSSLFYWCAVWLVQG